MQDINFNLIRKGKSGGKQQGRFAAEGQCPKIAWKKKSCGWSCFMVKFPTGRHYTKKKEQILKILKMYKISIKNGTNVDAIFDESNFDNELVNWKFKCL